MNPKEFEEFVSEYYRKHGYKTEITPYSNDYGVDVFA
jgi:restriction system protein